MIKNISEGIRSVDYCYYEYDAILTPYMVLISTPTLVRTSVTSRILTLSSVVIIDEIIEKLPVISPQTMLL